VAETPDEVMHWPLDKRILMGNLAQRIIAEKTDQRAVAVNNGIAMALDSINKANKK